jgi:conjugative relaxase-like TrwC/TraI family protein
VVLTIRKIVELVGRSGGAQAAARYYLQPAQSPEAFARGDSWMSPDSARPGLPQRANAMWIGSSSALAALGLTRGDEVTVQDLTAALRGQRAGKQVRNLGVTSRLVKDEHGDVRLDADGKPLREKGLGLVNLDLTFSIAPKSLSALWSQAGPEQRAQIERAMLIAANAALEHIAQTKPVVRRRVGAVRTSEPALGMAAAAILHVTARRAAGEKVPSPQLHVHGVLVGVERFDGTFAAADSWALFKRDAALEGGAVGRAVLADELVKLGYDIESGTGRRGRFFEVRGVPRGLVDRMSGRAKEVQRATREIELARGEKLRGAALAVVAKQTRQAKDVGVCGEEVARIWEAQGQEFGFGRVQAAALQGRPGYGRSLQERRAQAWAEIERRMLEFGPTVSDSMARAIAYEVAPGRLSYEETHALIDEMERAGALLAVGGGRVTTREIRRLEETMIAAAGAAAQRPGRPLPDRALAAGIDAANRALGEGKTLDAEQLKAFRTLTGGAGWVVLTGRAGTGKGDTLHAIAAAYRAADWQVIACAVDGTTKERLREQIHAETSHTIKMLTNGIASGTVLVDRRTVILIDEASKVGLLDWLQIAKLSSETGVRVVAVGHDGQHDAIQLPGMFGAMLEDPRIPVATLTDIRRHRDPFDPAKLHPWLAEYQTAIDEGRGRDAIAILRREGALGLHNTREQAMGAMVDDWDDWRRSFASGETLLLVHGSNDDVDQVNRLAQERRLAAGELQGYGIGAVDRDYLLYEGDVVILRSAPYYFDSQPADRAPRRVENGQVGVVDSVDLARDRVRVLLCEPGQEPRLVVFDLARLRAEWAAAEALLGPERAKDEARVPALRLAYASHTFPAQGATVKATASLGARTQRQEDTYVAETRSVYFHWTYVAHEDFGWPDSEQRLLDRLARQIATPDKRVASIRLELDSGARINVDLPVAEPLPDAPLRDADRTLYPPSVQPEVPALDRSAIEVPDPLARYRIVLGSERADWIDAWSQLLAEEVEGRDETWLRDERDATAQAFASLDRQGALETLRVQRDRRIVSERMTRAAVEGRHEQAERQEAQLARLAQAEQRLLDSGRHLDQWMTADEGHNVRRAAKWVAVMRELAIVRELEVAREVELSIGAPPAYIKDAIGPAPELTAAERAEWEAIVRVLERDRIFADLARRDREEPRERTGGEQRELDRRIEALRERRGMEPAVQRGGVDVEGPAF